MEPCPNCSRPVEAGATICPDCGARTRPPQTGRLLTGIEWLDGALGFILGILSVLPVGIGTLVAIVFYFLMREKYPAFTRGLKYALLTLAALLLGALAICVALITQGGLRNL